MGGGHTAGVMAKASAWMAALLGVTFGAQCAICGRGTAALCATCWRGLRPAPPLPPPAHVDHCRSLLAYEGPARAMLVRLKYRNERGALIWLACGMADLARNAVEEAGIDTVTWAPTSGARRRARGYDQAELLARAVARQLDLPCRRLLVRLPGPPQTGRSRCERQRGPGFVATGRALPPGVLLVDDVMTTGATASAGASALRGGGVRTVIVVTAATTLLKNSTASVDP